MKDLKEYQDDVLYTEKNLGYFNKLIDSAYSNTLETMPTTAFNSELVKVPINATNQYNSVIFYIPEVFLKTKRNDIDPAFPRIREMFRNLLKEVQNQNVYIIPKIQFSEKKIPLECPTLKVISYHTTGKESNNLRIKESSFKNQFTMDPYGYSGWHSIVSITEHEVDLLLEHIPNDIIEAFYNDVSQKIVLSNESIYNQNNKEEREYFGGEPFYFLPLQSLDDSDRKLACISTYELAEKLIQYSDQYYFNLVIKRHPMCESIEIHKLLKSTKRKHRVIISEDTTHSIIDKCSAIFTVNSDVGFEALLHLKPVITTGFSSYNVATCLIQNDLELKLFLKENNDFCDEEFIKKFLYLYFNRFVCSSTDKAKMSRIIKVFLENVNGPSFKLNNKSKAYKTLLVS